MDSITAPLRSHDPVMRREAVKRILEAQDRSALPALVSLIGSEADVKVKAALAYALGVLGDGAHVAVLAPLTHKQEAEVRYRAAEGLARIRHPSGFPTLVRSLAADADDRVRRVALQALLKLGTENLTTLLRMMIGSMRDWQRQAAIIVCSLFNSPAVVPLLVEAHDKGNEEDSRLALQGLERLGGLGNELAAKALEKIRSRDRQMEALRAGLDEQMKRMQEAQADRFDFDKTFTGDLKRVEIGASPFGSDGVPEVSPPLPGARPPIAEPYSPTPANFFTDPVEASDFHVDQDVVAQGRAIAEQARKSRGTVPLGAAIGESATEKSGANQRVSLGKAVQSDPEPSGEAPISPPTGRGPPVARASRLSALPGPGRADPARTAPGGPPAAAGKTRPCPVCGEEIAVAAKKCRFCNEIFDREGVRALRNAPSAPTEARPTKLTIATALATLQFVFFLFSGFMALASGSETGLGMAIGIWLVGGLFYAPAYYASRGSRVGIISWRAMAWFGVALSAYKDGPAAAALGVLFTVLLLHGEDVDRYCSQ